MQRRRRSSLRRALKPPLLELSIDAERESNRATDTIRTMPGGPTTYAVTVSVRNVTTVVLANLTVSGSARTRWSDDAATLELDPPPPIQPGQTWEQTVEVELPAPVVGQVTWTAVASGAGSIVETEQAMSNVPVALYVLIAVVVVDLVVIVWRRRLRRRRRRWEVADELDDTTWDPTSVYDQAEWDDAGAEEPAEASRR